MPLKDLLGGGGPGGGGGGGFNSEGGHQVGTGKIQETHDHSVNDQRSWSEEVMVFSEGDGDVFHRAGDKFLDNAKVEGDLTLTDPGAFEFAGDAMAWMTGATNTALENIIEFARDSGESAALAMQETQRGAFEMVASVEESDTAKVTDVVKIGLVAAAAVGIVWAWRSRA